MGTSGVADTGQAKERAKETAAQAKEKASEVADQAQEQMHQAAGKAKGRVRTQLDERSTETGERIVTQAGDIRSVGQSLREQGNTGAANVADQAAERVEQVGAWLRDKDADQILDQVEDAARRNPWAVFAGSVAAGFAISRVLKASSADRYRTRTAGGPMGRSMDGDMPMGSAPGTDTASTSMPPRTGRFERRPGSGVQTGTAGSGTDPIRGGAVDPGAGGRF